MAAQMRILHMISSLNIGGSQTFVMNLYRNIDRESIQFDFIIDHPKEIYFQKEIESLGGVVYYMPAFQGTNIKKVRQAWKKFFRNHPEYKILHSHSRSYAALYLPIAKKFGLTTIIHSHSTSNGKGMRAVVKKFLQYPLRYQADYFMACSQKAGEWLFGKKICCDDRFYVIKNAIDAKKLKFDAKKRIVSRKKLGLTDEFTLGFLARVSEPKNPVFVIEIFYELKKRNSNAKLLFVGEGELLQEVKQRAYELEVIEDILFTGVRTDIENMLFAMDCYILPSLWEGLGISLIEAQASGLSCICSENIPLEAEVTEHVKVLYLSEPASKWARSIQKNDGNREWDNEVIINAGYDIAYNAIYLSDFYRKCCEEKR